jgi:hypothetical protein
VCALPSHTLHELFRERVVLFDAHTEQLAQEAGRAAMVNAVVLVHPAAEEGGHERGAGLYARDHGLCLAGSEHVRGGQNDDVVPREVGIWPDDVGLDAAGM